MIGGLVMAAGFTADDGLMMGTLLAVIGVLYGLPTLVLAWTLPTDSAGESDPPFHSRLRLVRTERNVSRKDLAEVVGVHYQTIGYIERGEYTPSLALALKQARYFDLPVEALSSLDPFPPLSAETLTKRGLSADRGQSSVIRPGHRRSRNQDDIS
jgi:DNA-binding XRE family transcriptional regulator